MFAQFLKSLLGGGQDDPVLADALARSPLLLDVRTPGEFAGGSVLGAVNIPLQDLSAHLKDLPKGKSIVVFCRSGSRSSMAKSLLEQHGFANIVDGGTWQRVNDFFNTKK